MLELTAQKRDINGKKVKTLRKTGLLPAVVYGEQVETRAVSVPFREFETVYKSGGESTLVTLHMPESKDINVLIYDVTFHPLAGTPLHADFRAVRMDKPIRTWVPLVFEGESPAVKNDGGVLIKVVQDIEVEALPAKLPSQVVIDLSRLNEINARVTVEDLAIPDDVKIFSESHDVIALVEAPRTTEELEELEKPTDEEAAPGEVQTEREAKQEAGPEDSTDEASAVETSEEEKKA